MVWTKQSVINSAVYKQGQQENGCLDTNFHLAASGLIQS